MNEIICFLFNNAKMQKLLTFNNILLGFIFNEWTFLIQPLSELHESIIIITLADLPKYLEVGYLRFQTWHKIIFCYQFKS